VKGLEGEGLLRARKRSSERIAMALSRRTKACDAVLVGDWGRGGGRVG